MTRVRTDRKLVAVAVASLLAAAASAGDWPRYRGANHDGVSSEGIDDWPPTEIWRASVGWGYSQATVVDGKVYTAGWASSQDTVYCFDEASVGNDPAVPPKNPIRRLQRAQRNPVGHYERHWR